MDNNTEDEDNELQETLEYLSNQLEENYKLKTTNMYGGQGGFGLVLFVYDMNDTQKKYAVKAQSIINKNSGQINQNLLKQCRDEAKVMRECKHKNVVEIKCDFVLGFYHFIQMDLCQCSLNDWILQNKQKQLSDLVFLHYANQIIDGLEYLHNLDYVLRDVSVRNILLTTEGVIKLCDFGLAKKYDNTLKSKALYSQHVQGVLFYFPPEIHEAINENRIQIKQTKEGDIWALGVCLCLIGGVTIGYFSATSHNNFTIPDAPNISHNANQLIKFILVRNHRPSFKEIREHIQSLFFQQQSFSFEKSKVDSSTNSNSTKFGSQEQSTSSQISSENSMQTAIVFINNYRISNDIQNKSNAQTIKRNDEQIKDRDSQIKDSDSLIKLSDSQIKSSTQIIVRRVEFNFIEGDSLYSQYKQHLEMNEEDVDTLVSLGHLEIKYKCNFEQGQYYLEKAIQLKQSDIDAYLGLCESFILQRQARNYQKVEQYIDICMKLNTNENGDNVYWRIVYIQAWLKYTQEKFYESEEYINKAILKNSKSAVLISLHALIKGENKQELEQGRIMLQKCLSYNELNDPIVHYRCGYFFQYHLHQIQQSISFYKTVLSLCNNAHLMTHYHLIIIYAQSSNQEQELQKLQSQMLTLYPQNSATYEVLGLIQPIQDEKIKFFYQAIECDPQQINPYLQLAEIKRSQSLINESIELYNQILQIDPDNFQALLSLGNIEQSKYNQILAMNYYKQALRSNPRQDDSKYLEGLICELNENRVGAVKLFEEAVEMNPQHIEGYKKLIKIEKELNKDVGKAIRINKQGVVNNERSEELIESLIQLYMMNGQYKDQISELQHLVNIKPTAKGIYYQIAYLYQTKLNDIDTALSYYLQENFIQNTEITFNNIALIYHHKQLFDKAYQNFQNALLINPKSEVAQFNMGLLLRDMKKFDQSINCFLQILQTNPLHSQSYFELGLIYQNYQIDLNKAIEMYERGLQINDKVVIVFLNLGMIYKQLNNTDKAIQNLTKYYSFNPRDIQASFELANLFLTINDTHLASFYLVKTIEVDPNHQKAWYLLAQAQKKEKRFQEAINSLNRYRLINPQDIQALVELAEIEVPQIAKELYKQVLLKDPLHKLSLLSLNKMDPFYKKELFQQTKVEFANDNYIKTIELIKQRLAIEPDHLQSLIDLGYIYLGQNMKEEASEALQKALKINPYDQTANFYMGELEQNQNQNLDKALDYYKRAEELNYKSSILHQQMGLIYIEKKDYAIAIYQLEKSLKLDTKNARSHYYLGWIQLNKQKKPKKAIKSFMKSLETSGDVPKTHYYLGLAFDQLNFKFQAKEQFEAVLRLNPSYQFADQCQQYIIKNQDVQKVEYKDSKCNIF